MEDRLPSIEDPTQERLDRAEKRRLFLQRVKQNYLRAIKKREPIAYIKLPRFETKEPGSLGRSMGVSRTEQSPQHEKETQCGWESTPDESHLFTRSVDILNRSFLYLSEPPSQSNLESRGSSPTAIKETIVIPQPTPQDTVQTPEKPRRKPVVQLKQSQTPYLNNIRVLRNQDLEHVCSEQRPKISLPDLKENLFKRMSLQLRPTKRITIVPSP